MPLVSLQDVLGEAKNGSYAVGRLTYITEVLSRTRPIDPALAHLASVLAI